MDLNIFYQYNFLGKSEFRINYNYCKRQYTWYFTKQVITKYTNDRTLVVCLVIMNNAQSQYLQLEHTVSSMKFSSHITKTDSKDIRLKSSLSGVWFLHMKRICMLIMHYVTYKHDIIIYSDIFVKISNDPKIAKIDVEIRVFLFLY